MLVREVKGRGVFGAWRDLRSIVACFIRIVCCALVYNGKEIRSAPVVRSREKPTARKLHEAKRMANIESSRSEGALWDCCAADWPD